jgi:hypothetical protein
VRAARRADNEIQSFGFFGFHPNSFGFRVVQLKLCVLNDLWPADIAAIEARSRSWRALASLEGLVRSE